MTNNTSRGIVMSLERDQAVFSNLNYTNGSARIPVACQYAGNPLKLGINAQYLGDVLRVYKSDKIALELSRGLIMREPGATFLIMPISLPFLGAGPVASVRRMPPSRIHVPADEPPWSEALAVAAQLRQAGFQAWCVGGCVRDLLLQRPLHDVDLATDAVPEAIERIFPRTIAVGRSFGVVVVVLPGGRQVEVATFRHDGRYLDGRHPEQVRFGTVQEDVPRRDFTINALLLDPLTGEILDQVGGIADLQGRILRCVGDPLARLQEDRLRVLRALRFAAVLGLTIEPATAAGLAATSLAGLSAERVMQEWFKALASGQGPAWMRLAQGFGRLAEIVPPLAAAGLEQLAEEARALERLETLLGESPDPALALRVRLGGWLAPVAPAPALAWLEQQPLERGLVRAVRWLLERFAALPGYPALALAQRRRWARSAAAPSWAC